MIVSDLEGTGYLTHSRIGRRNARTVDPHRPFRHPAGADRDVRDLTALCTGHDEARPHGTSVHRATSEGTSHHAP